LSMAVSVAQTTWFKEWLRGFIVRQAEDYVNGRLSIGRLDGNLFFGVELEDIDVTMNGKTVVNIKIGRARLHRPAGGRLRERTAVDRAAGREPLFRRRARGHLRHDARGDGCEPQGCKS